MQQLKMQLRSILNTILDIRFHCHDLDEAGAMRLMTERGYQEVGEASNKWRRVQLTSTQLCSTTSATARCATWSPTCARAQPSWSEREVHDAVLAHGSPPVRHLRTLVLG